MFYCSENCQKKDMKFHKCECEYLKKHYDILRDNTARFLLRLYLTLKRYPDERTELWKIPNTDPKVYRSYNDLTLTRAGQEKVEMKTEALQELQKILNDFCESDLDYDSLIMFDHFEKIIGNTFGYQNIDMKQIGLAIYVIESAYEHSCVPNACVVYNGTTIQVVALKNIYPGEKITISYVPLIYSQEVRAGLLESQFSSKCSCIKCTGDAEDGKF